METHRFDPVEAALWRNSVLDFASLAALLASLAAPPRRMGLRSSEEALDERVLRQLAVDEDVAKRASDRSALSRLWDACQTPDFRKTTLEDHLRLTRDLFINLTGPAERVPEDWMAEGLARIDRLDGEIEALSTRLAGVRTLAYVAHRPDWLADPAHWRERTRDLEDRLSDTLHEKLMARFVDQRTSALIRGLGARRELLAGVGADGVVTVEGFTVGRLSGLAINPARGASVLEQKALRRAAERVVGPEINRRLGALAADKDEAFALAAGGLALWRGQAAGAVTLADPFSPTVRLLTELGAAPARERAARRLEAFAAAETRRRWAPLWRLSQAVREGGVQGLARGVAWRLVEGGGTLIRREVETEVAALSRAERRQLRRLGVRIGAFALDVPSLLTADAAILAAMLAPGDARAEALQGRVRLGGIAASTVELEALAEALRAAPSRHGGRRLTRSALAAVGVEAARAEMLLRALGFAPVGRAEADGSRLWRRRREAPAKAAQPHSPFAVLARLEAAPHRRRSRRGQRG